MMIYAIALIVIFAICAIALIYRGFKCDDKTLKKWGSISAALAVLIALFALLDTVISRLIKTPESACFCQSATDDLTARCLIRSESDAANRGDLDAMTRIFAPDATIYRGDQPTTWHGPKAYYQPSFDALKFSEAIHFDVKQENIIGDALYYTSGSSGNYTERSSGAQNSYQNLNPSEHWVFQKNSEGCWVVTHYDFNDSHDPFPDPQGE